MEILGVGVMNLDEMLLYADIGQINKIADQYQCQCDRHSKTDLIQAIIYKLLKRDTIEDILYGLEPVEYTFIQLLYLDSRNKFTLEDLLAKGKQAINLSQTSITSKDIVFRALKKGWVFQGVGKKHLLIYLVPQDLKRKMLIGIQGDLEKRLDIRNEINFYRDESNLLVSDMIRFLTYVTKNDISLTAEGNIYKRQQQAIFGSFLVPEEPIKKVAWRFGFGRRYNEYPDRFSLIYDYSFYQKFIVEDQEGLLFISPSGGKWLTQTTYDQEEIKIYQFWVRLYKHPIPYLQLIVKYMDLIAYQRWVEIESLEKEILFWLEDFYYEKKKDIFKERIIKMLLHLGVIQLGNEDGEIYIRVTDNGHHWINGFVNFDVKGIVLKK